MTGETQPFLHIWDPRLSVSPCLCCPWYQIGYRLQKICKSSNNMTLRDYRGISSIVGTGNLEYTCFKNSTWHVSGRIHLGVSSKIGLSAVSSIFNRTFHYKSPSHSWKPHICVVLSRMPETKSLASSPLFAFAPPQCGGRHPGEMLKKKPWSDLTWPT